MTSITDDELLNTLNHAAKIVLKKAMNYRLFTRDELINEGWIRITRYGVSSVAPKFLLRKCIFLILDYIRLKTKYNKPQYNASLAQLDISLDKIRGSDGSYSLIDFITNRDNISLHKMEHIDLVKFLLEDISDRDKYIIHLRFTKGLTYPQIGEIVGKTHQSITWIINYKILPKLRERARIEEFKVRC